MAKIIDNTKSVVNERQVEAALVREAGKAGGWAVKFLPLHVKGLPDRLVILPGGVVGFVEVKRPGGRLSPAQKIILSRLSGLGCRVAVVYGVEDVAKTLAAWRR